MFPRLESATGPLSDDLRLSSAVLALTPLQGFLSARRADTGRPARDRAALATAFVAKAIMNLSTTRDPMSRLQVDQALRRLCGWSSFKALPHESKLSRAFAEFAASELPQQLHAALVATTQQQRLIGHIARHSTAILARERFPETAKQRSRPGGRKKKNPPSARFAKRRAASKARACSASASRS